MDHNWMKFHIYAQASPNSRRHTTTLCLGFLNAVPPPPFSGRTVPSPSPLFDDALHLPAAWSSFSLPTGFCSAAHAFSLHPPQRRASSSPRPTHSPHGCRHQLFGPHLLRPPFWSQLLAKKRECIMWKQMHAGQLMWKHMHAWGIKSIGSRNKTGETKIKLERGRQKNSRGDDNKLLIKGRYCWW